LQTDKNDQLEYYLSSLNELGEVLIDAGDIRSVGSGILRLTLGTVMASTGSVLLYNKEKNFSFLAGQGIKNKESFTFTEKTIDHLKKYRHGHITLNNTPDWIAGKLKNHITESKTYILLPLFHKELFLGLLCVGNKFMGETYSNNDIKILEIISSHLTKALYNYKLFKNVEEKKTELNLKLLELETLFDISIAISSVLDIDDLAEDVLWRSVGILNASKGIFLRLKNNTPILHIAATFNWVKENPLLSQNLKVFKDVQSSSQGIVLSDKDETNLQQKLKEKNLIVSPLMAKNKILGYMVLCNKESRKGIEPFNSVDLDLLTALSNQAAVAMENAKLFKEITKEKQFNESILGSIATGVVTINTLGEVDSINIAATKILNTKKKDIIGNHYMFVFEKDETVVELITSSEDKNKTVSDVNISLAVSSKDTAVNISVSPRVDPDGKMQGQVIAFEDITDVNKVKNTFKRYVSKQVVDEILDNDSRLNLGGEKRKVTVLFADIRGFTSMSEKMEPEVVVSTLNEYFSEMIDIVFKNNGTLDKIIGDELMVVYGAPISAKDDTIRAVQTASDMQEKLKELNKERKKRKEPLISVGIGINRGEVVSGNIGSREMMDYTVIGDTVNLAARLCSSAKPGQTLVSDSVFIKTEKTFNFKKLEPLSLKGKRKRVSIFLVEQ
tara:strand:+ start:719 stop:2731 length:2013 start_codon:yes stop_codon:yes gene_type:complete